MKALEDAFNPVKAKAIEFEMRADTVKDVDREISKANDLVKKIKDEMTWVPKEDLEKAEKKLTEFTESWTTKKTEQEAKEGWEEPVFTKEQINEEMIKAVQDIFKLSRMKKPKERKPKAPKGRGAGKKDDKKKGKNAA